MTGWLERLHLIRPTEEHQMSQSPYGPQGTPVSVPSAPPEPQPTPEPHATAALPGDAGVTVDAAETAQPSGLVPPVALTAQQAADAAALKAARGLVTAWANIAETTLVRGDYEKGQRDATLTRSDELRKALGL